MRAREILEASLSRVSTPSNWSTYLNNLANANNIQIGDSGQIKQNLVLDDTSKKIVNDLKQEVDTALAQGGNVNQLLSRVRATKVKFTDGSEYKIADIFKSTEIKGRQLETRSFGTAAEGLLGAAMFAKLTARQGDLIAEITAADVWAVINSTQNNPTFSKTVNDINNQVADQITLETDLSIDVKNLFFEPSLRPRFDPYVEGFVRYANSSLAEVYANMLFKNNRFDNVTILLQGKKGSKIDVKINVLNDQGQATRKLEQVKYSVKLSKSLIGQMARGRNSQEVYRNLENLFKPLGVNFSKEKKEEILSNAEMAGIEMQYADAMETAYEEAAQQLKSLARTTNSVQGNAKFVADLANFVNLHATENDPTIQTIEVDSDQNYRILSYNQLFREIKNKKIDVDVDSSIGYSDKYKAPLPSITFFDRARGNNNQGKLLEIRFRFRGAYANHAIIPHPLLKDLATYRRYK